MSLYKLFTSHKMTLYHKNSTQKADGFLEVFSVESTDVRNVIEVGRQKVVVANRKHLVHIIKTIY